MDDFTETVSSCADVMTTVRLSVDVFDQNKNELIVTDIQGESKDSHMDVTVNVPKLVDKNFNISDEDGNTYDITDIADLGSSKVDILIEVPDKAYKYETAVKLLDKEGNTLMQGDETQISIGNPHTDQNPMEITLSEKAYKQIYTKMRKEIIQEVIENLFNEKEEA